MIARLTMTAPERQERDFFVPREQFHLYHEREHVYMHEVLGVERVRPDERTLLQQRFGGGTTLGRWCKSQVDNLI